MSEVLAGAHIKIDILLYYVLLWTVCLSMLYRNDMFVLIVVFSEEYISQSYLMNKHITEIPTADLSGQLFFPFNQTTATSRSTTSKANKSPAIVVPLVFQNWRTFGKWDFFLGVWKKQITHYQTTYLKKQTLFPFHYWLSTPLKTDMTTENHIFNNSRYIFLNGWFPSSFVRFPGCNRYSYHGLQESLSPRGSIKKIFPAATADPRTKKTSHCLGYPSLKHPNTNSKGPLKLGLKKKTRGFFFHLLATQWFRCA